MAKTFAAGEGGHLEEHNKWAQLIEDLEDPNTDPDKYPALQGPPGPPGEDGKSAYEQWLEAGNSGTENDFLESLKGEPGEPGPPGEDGQNGEDGQTPTALHTTYIEDDIIVDTTEFKFVEAPGHPIENFQSDQLSVHLNGVMLTPDVDYTSSFKKFDVSPSGNNELTITLTQPAAAGDVLIAETLYAFNSGGGGGTIPGPAGEDGKSAYEIAVENGFVGTEQEWLDSLQGADGPPGESAYEVAVDNGFVGTESEWLDSLQGEDGKGVQIKGTVASSADLAALSATAEDGDIYIALDTGDGWVYDADADDWTNIGPIRGPEGPEGPEGDSAYEVWLDAGNSGTVDDYLDSLKGDAGADGSNGTDGAPGEDGADGKGWTGGSYSSGTGKVTFTSDDGLGFETGDLRGEDGADGQDSTVPGPKGDPFEYEDFTPEQLAGLVGPPGPPVDLPLADAAAKVLTSTGTGEGDYAWEDPQAPGDVLPVPDAADKVLTSTGTTAGDYEWADAAGGIDLTSEREAQLIQGDGSGGWATGMALKVVQDLPADDDPNYAVGDVDPKGSSWGDFTTSGDEQDSGTYT